MVNEIIMMKATMVDFMTIRFLSLLDIPPVMERKTGIVPKGLINVKIEVKQSSEKGSTDSIFFYFSFINF